MNLIPRTDSLNVARSRPHYPPMSWLILGASVALCLGSLWPLMSAWDHLDAAQVQQRTLSQEMVRQEADAKKKKQEKVSTLALERDKARAQIQELTQLSWDGIFDALEIAANAVQSGVTIVALTPSKVQADSVQLTMTALASNAPIMLTYLSELKLDARVLQVELISQQAEDKMGLGVVRFQFTLVCNPKIQVTHPPRPLSTLSSAPPVLVRPNAIVPISILQGSKTQ